MEQESADPEGGLVTLVQSPSAVGISPPENLHGSEEPPDLTVAMASLGLSARQAPTCYVFDSFMLKHRILSLPDHVECPERISRIYTQLVEDGLIKRCQRVPSRFATLQELCSVHDETYVKLLIEKSTETVEEMIYFQEQFDSVYFCSDTFKCAALAAGCLIELTEAVLSGEAKNGFALIRPPGHHADCDLPSGFCFVNNIAVAVQCAIEKFGLKRVLIVDWDVHHGNGTQRIFYDRKDVLFISLHRYDGGYFYPAKSHSHFKHIGEGVGLGYSVNIPFTGGKMGDSEYLAAFRQIVMPIATTYKPEVVFVSAGFDAALGDPLGGYKLSPQCYGTMTTHLKTLAGGRVILALEGGYNLTSIALSFSACVESLLLDEGTPRKSLQGSPHGGALPCRQAFRMLNDAKTFLQQIWPCLIENSSGEDVYEFKGD